MPCRLAAPPACAGAMTAQDAAQPSTPVLGTPFWHHDQHMHACHHGRPGPHAIQRLHAATFARVCQPRSPSAHRLTTLCTVAALHACSAAGLHRPATPSAWPVPGMRDRTRTGQFDASALAQ